MQVETADFIKIKEEELKAISEHFENLNKMEIDKIEDVTESPKNTIDATKPPQTKAKSPSPSPAPAPAKPTKK
jgi:BRCT domain type II-containing protein